MRGVKSEELSKHLDRELHYYGASIFRFHACVKLVLSVETPMGWVRSAFIVRNCNN